MSSLETGDLRKPKWFPIAPKRIQIAWDSLQIGSASDELSGLNSNQTQFLPSAIGTSEVLAAARRSRRQMVVVGFLSLLILGALIGLSWSLVFSTNDLIHQSWFHTAIQWNGLFSTVSLLINSYVLWRAWKLNQQLVLEHQHARKRLLLEPDQHLAREAQLLELAHVQLTVAFVSRLTGSRQRAYLALIVGLTALAAVIPWMQLLFWLGDIE